MIAVEKTDLPISYQKYPLIPTCDGATDTVYHLGDAYILKVFNPKTPATQIDDEVTLLASLQSLPVPRVVAQCTVRNHPALIYTRCTGKSPRNPDLAQVGQIGIFLRNFHAQSARIPIRCHGRYGRSALEELTHLVGEKHLRSLWQSRDLDWEEHGVIHGDLFPDNCTFEAGKLRGVFDFSGVCRGDIRFDLGVVAAGWCFDGSHPNTTKMTTLLHHYDSDISLSVLIPYIRAALLYYGMRRRLHGRDDRPLIQRLEALS